MAQLKQVSQAGHMLKAAIADPALGFAICSIIYASKSTTVAIICAFACAMLIITLGIARQCAGTQLPAHILKHLHDDGLSLRILGVLGLASGVYTLTMQTGSNAHALALLQGISGILFAAANFMLAASMSGARAMRHPLVKILLQAETWILAGMLCLGLMAGAQALIMLPFMLMGYAITLGNIRHQRPEHHGHPKLFYAAATLGFAAFSPDGWLLLANIINAACLVSIEHRLTPGGLFARAALQKVRA